MKITSRSQLGELLTHFNLPRVVAEIGVAEGRYAEEMLKWDLELLFLVDIWETMPFIPGCASFPQEWHDVNYKRVVDIRKVYGYNNVKILKGFSHKVCKIMDDDIFFGLIYLDAAHDYNSVKVDIDCWYPKLVSGGIMAFHDFGNVKDYGVNRAVYEFASAYGLEVNELIEDGKIENKGAWIQKI